jgi:predicted cupin superfamily sugar epimerase
MERNADFWIEKLGLVEHPEGGYFCETYRSSDQIALDCLPARFTGARLVSTAIYYLLRGNQYSALHRLRADELWHHYAGSSLTLFLIDPSGTLSELRLGPDLSRGERFQVIVPAGRWFGATVDDPDSFSLAGCTVAPGFSPEDFELGTRDALLERYPQHAALIERLTRA